MRSKIVAQPRIQVLGLSFIRHQVRAATSFMRVLERWLVHGKGPYQHRLLRDVGMSQSREFIARHQDREMPVGGQCGFKVGELCEIKL
jgi:hypothetical protein